MHVSSLTRSMISFIYRGIDYEYVFLSCSFLKATGRGKKSLPLDVPLNELMWAVNPFAAASQIFGTPDRSTFMDNCMSTDRPSPQSFHSYSVVLFLRFCTYVYRNKKLYKKNPRIQGQWLTYYACDEDDDLVMKAQEWFRGARPLEGKQHRGEILAPGYRPKVDSDICSSKYVLTMNATSEVR